jgi:hypothetical protein
MLVGIMAVQPTFSNGGSGRDTPSLRSVASGVSLRVFGSSTAMPAPRVSRRPDPVSSPVQDRLSSLNDHIPALNYVHLIGAAS